MTGPPRAGTGSLSAATSLVGVIGDPVRHSLSPALHNAAFAALSLDWVSVAFEVGRETVGGALEGVRSLGLRGVSVTMPLKEAVVELADSMSPTVERLGAANCIVATAGALHADNTDGAGLLASLHRGAGFDAAGARCFVQGAGGAARAAVLALAGAGAAEIVVVGRSPQRAAAAAALAGPAGRVGEASEAAEADLVVNATPAGMSGTPAARVMPAVDPRLLHAGQLVVDLVYEPRRTPWLAGAAEHGATTVGGLGMLVHQAAAQIELWTGCPAPVEEMWRAVTA